MNKRTIILAFTLLLTTTIFYGQRRPDREKIKSLKIAFITEKLDLSSKEATVFWPIYNKYEEAINELRKKEREQHLKKNTDLSNISDKEAKDFLLLEIKDMEAKHALEMNFVKTMMEKISPKKTMLLLQAERGFKRQLIKQYHKKHGEGKH